MFYRFLRRAPIIAFCLWHMAAVAVYALPDNLKDTPGLVGVYQYLARVTRPYMLMTSQWQKWPLFAPDPLRRVSIFVVEAQNAAGEWTPVKRIAPETLEWWRMAAELKTLRRLEEEPRYGPLRERYAQEACAPAGLPTGTPLRLQFGWYVIPRYSPPFSIAYWRQWEPQWYWKVDLQTVCPALI